MNDLKRAISDFKKAVTYDSKFINNWFILISTMLLNGETDEAMKDENR